jgi:hypothetical protein
MTEVTRRAGVGSALSARGSGRPSGRRPPKALVRCTVEEGADLRARRHLSGCAYPAFPLKGALTS